MSSDPFDGIAESAKIRRQMRELCDYPTRSYKLKFIRCMELVHAHLGQLGSILREKDREVARLKDLLGQRGEDPYTRVSEQLPPLDVPIVVWDDYNKCFDAIQLNPGAFWGDKEAELRAYLSKHHYTHWQRLSRPTDVMNTMTNRLVD